MNQVNEQENDPSDYAITRVIRDVVTHQLSLPRLCEAEAVSTSAHTRWPAAQAVASATESGTAGNRPGAIEQVVDLQDRGRCQEDRHRPAPP
jgi:hypothetical protein